MNIQSPNHTFQPQRPRKGHAWHYWHLGWRKQPRFHPLHFLSPITLRFSFFPLNSTHSLLKQFIFEFGGVYMFDLLPPVGGGEQEPSLVYHYIPTPSLGPSTQ